MAQNGPQDLPPKGGFSEIKYRRYLPKRGPSGLVIVAGVTAVSAFGFYKVYQGNIERRYYLNPIESQHQLIRSPPSFFPVI
jgi:NADH dehydrogenase (ubiquinone) 1 alpha subcomplex subunit 13